MTTNISSRLKIDNFLELIYPNLCTCCLNIALDAEDVICENCFITMPKTYYHLNKNNDITKRFIGKADIEMATSFFFYKISKSHRQLIRKLKYSDREDIGITLGRHAGKELICSEYFQNIDLIVPVPLHKNKQNKRGYNQSLCIAEGLSDAMGVPIDEYNLYRAIENPSQTNKSTDQRWKNSKGIFVVRNGDIFNNKCILLVDDVLTTGSTIIACTEAIKEKSNAIVMVFTMTIT